MQTGAASVLAGGIQQPFARTGAVPLQATRTKAQVPYMQPTDLKAIARDATLRGDTKTLVHALDLLERVVPIATFMDFCTELDELRLQGARPQPH